jgi:hypothetical protein
MTEENNLSQIIQSNLRENFHFQNVSSFHKLGETNLRKLHENCFQVDWIQRPERG